MPKLAAAAVVVIATAIHAAPAAAVQFEVFHLDPSRSTLAFVSGDVQARLSDTQFAFAPLVAQPGFSSAPLTGDFVLEIGNDATNPSSFDVLPGTSDIRASDIHLASPAPGGAPGTTAAAIGLSFADATSGISGEVALHDLVFAAAGSFTVVGNGLGPFGLQGTMPWSLVNGAFEIATNAGIGGTALIPFLTSASASVDATTSQFTEVSPGVYEVVIPYQFLIGLSPVAGPLSSTIVRARFAGEIVATTALVPEPALGLMLGIAGCLIACHRTTRRAS